jgi:hypothetical protein
MVGLGEGEVDEYNVAWQQTKRPPRLPGNGLFVRRPHSLLESVTPSAYAAEEVTPKLLLIGHHLLF